jgi:hypothetical protein
MDSNVMTFKWFLVSLLLSCQSPDKLIGDSNVFSNPDTDDTSITLDLAVDYSTVSSILANASVGDEVFIDGVSVITPSDDQGFFVGDQNGGQNSGIWIQADFEEKSAFDVTVDSVVSVRGVFQENVEEGVEHQGTDSSLSSINVSSVTNVIPDEDDAIASVTPTPITALEDDLEPYEGTLVTISSPVVTLGTDSQVYLENRLPVVGRFMTIPIEDIMDSIIIEITGVVGYENGFYALYPRISGDIVLEEIPSPVPAYQIYFSELLTTASPLVMGCNSDFEWYLEFHYSATNTENIFTDHLYVVRESANGTEEYSKMSSRELSPNMTAVILNTGTYCIENPASNINIDAIELSPVSNLSFPSLSKFGIGDTISLYTAETEEGFFQLVQQGLSADSPNFLDQIEVNAIALNIGIELCADYNGESNDTVTPSDDAWSNSNFNINDLTGVPIIEETQYTPFRGTPETITNHCQ